MSFYDAIRVGASGAADSAFTVDRSLRFNNDDSAFLDRTPSSASNRKTMTKANSSSLMQTPIIWIC